MYIIYIRKEKNKNKRTQESEKKDANYLVSFFYRTYIYIFTEGNDTQKKEIAINFVFLLKYLALIFKTNNPHKKCA